ncbi:hypothetical protein GJ496_006769 [Pomphorhynchus laevis]|nr:hypothetical protein GJ496_003797 [Pomphorhynchus laevis]KAI0987447.1 hypothetical protein GJ496_006769 [Pomphorhynchus laevis]
MACFIQDSYQLLYSHDHQSNLPGYIRDQKISQDYSPVLYSPNRQSPSVPSTSIHIPSRCHNQYIYSDSLTNNSVYSQCNSFCFNQSHIQTTDHFPVSGSHFFHDRNNDQQHQQSNNTDIHYDSKQTFNDYRVSCSVSQQNVNNILINQIRDLHIFAARFKQKRIKLGITQSEVGSQLQSLSIPGIASLSQSTICRFESLTLSHNNMLALKPILESWLDWAGNLNASSDSKIICKNDCVSSTMSRKRKRTSIGLSEKHTLELYFAVQPRPNSESIEHIAEKLDLTRNVVRVWFCNQRQKQKRLRFCWN